MMTLIHALHTDAAINDVDIVYRAWRLRDPPICRKGLIEKLKEEDPIDAVVTD
jgi:hypothetical protein